MGNNTNTKSENLNIENKNLNEISEKRNNVINSTRAALGTLAIATALSFGNPGKLEAQTNSKPNSPKANTEAVEQVNPLNYVDQNIAKYYPDMVNHRNSMKNKFYSQEQKDSTIKFLQQTVMTIPSGDQKIAGVLGCIEAGPMNRNDVPSLFSESKYVDQISQETFDAMNQFDQLYKTRFDSYYTRIQKDIETMKNEIEIMKQQNEQMKQQNEQMKQNIANIDKENEQMKQQNEQRRQNMINIMNGFNTQQIKNDPNLAKIIIDTVDFFKKYGYSTNPHIETLYTIAKQTLKIQ